MKNKCPKYISTFQRVGFSLFAELHILQLYVMEISRGRILFQILFRRIEEPFLQFCGLLSHLTPHIM